MGALQIKRKALSSLTLLYPPAVHLLSGSLFGEHNRGALRVRELDEALLGLGGQGLIPKRIEYSERLIWFCTDDQTTASSYLRLASVVVKKSSQSCGSGAPFSRLGVSPRVGDRRTNGHECEVTGFRRHTTGVGLGRKSG